DAGVDAGESDEQRAAVTVHLPAAFCCLAVCRALFTLSASCVHCSIWRRVCEAVMPSARPSCRTSLLVHWNVWMRFPIAPADHPVARANRVVHTMHAGAKHVPRAVSVSSGCGVTSIPHSATNGLPTVGAPLLRVVSPRCLRATPLASRACSQKYFAHRNRSGMAAPHHGRICHNTPLGCMKQE